MTTLRPLPRLAGCLAAAALALGATPAHAVDDGPGGDPAEDLAPPQIQITRPGDDSTWHPGSVTVTIKATDPAPIASGVRSVSYALHGATEDTGTVSRTDGGSVAIGNEGTTEVAVEATDNNDNTATASAQVRIDRTVPAIAFHGRVQDGAALPWGATVLVDYECSDTLAGVADCSGSYADGGRVNTATLGEHALSVTAVDAAGNTLTRTIRYTVVEARYPVVSRPTASGSATVGATLSGSPATWSPAPASSSCQWWREGVGGVPGATGTSYVVTREDVGHRLAYRCTAAAGDGWFETTATSDWLGPVPGLAFPDDVGLRIVGTAKVGVMLMAVTTPGSLPEGTTRTFQWTRDGVPMAGVTGEAYRLRREDAGHRIKVTLSARATGYADRSWSRVTGPVAGDTTTRPPGTSVAPVPAQLRVTSRPRRHGAVVTVRVTARGTTPPGTVKVLRKGRVVGRGTVRNGVATIRIARLPKGKQRLVVRYLGTSRVLGAVRVVKVRVR